tara:strand:+ start:366 stop:911 length:546 start_codon:yes stop_codon:yes gene_type:complete
MAAPLVPILIGKVVYHISKPLFKKYAPQLTKATKKAVEEAGSIVRIGSKKLLDLLGGKQTTKASLSQKGVQSVIGKGAAGTFATGVVVGALLPEGGGSKYTPPGGTLAPTPIKRKKKSKLAGVKPGRKPTPPPAKAPTLPKAKEIKPHSTPPKGMKNPMIMKSGTKKYAKRSGGRVAKYKG